MYAEVTTIPILYYSICSKSWFQTLLYDLMKRMLVSGPVYAVLGNHDSYNQYVYSLYSLYLDSLFDHLIGRRMLPTLSVVT